MRATVCDERDLLYVVIDDGIMKAKASYLSRGQMLKNMMADDLRRAWISDFKAWFRTRDPSKARSFDDAQAELAIRCIAPPIADIKDELQQILLEMLADGPIRQEVGHLVDDFMRSLDGPRH